MEGYIEKKDQRNEIVGDLNVNADISGELKVNIQRGIIKSREDLAALQDLKKALQGEDSVDVETGTATNSSLGVIKKEMPAIIQNVDTLIFFK